MFPGRSGPNLEHPPGPNLEHPPGPNLEHPPGPNLEHLPGRITGRGGQVSMLGSPGGSGTSWAGGSGITTADSTLRSGRTWISSPEASMRQPRSPSSSSDATTTEGSACSAGACTEDVVLRMCRACCPG